MNAHHIVTLGEKVLAGYRLTADDALALSQVARPDIPLLAAYANKVRHHFAGEGVDMCGLVNARSGRCSEDCKFCAQSVYHTTASPVYPLLDSGQMVAAARKAQAEGAKRISVVTSGKGMEHDPDFTAILTAIETIIAETGLKVCANLGTITPVQAEALAAAGVKRYAHNLETSQRYYPSVCTTHSYAERLGTVAAAKAAGMELCTGGIIGLGETWQDRLDMAFALRDIDPISIPINILNPIKGTVFEGHSPLPPLEIIQTFAIFRLILPDKIIRPAGGREINLRDMQGGLMLAGANGLIIGNYLTFGGRDAAADFRMVQDAGLRPL
ncbi:MAG: biotin synthase BioB [Negativicutes bacterium]|nr:biotin synthase BioB [Negativicutes bacterium]